MAQIYRRIRDRFRELAISYNINIITGSMPYLKDDSLYNVGFLCRRDGSVDMYEKIHVTPDEQKCWGLSGGSISRLSIPIVVRLVSSSAMMWSSLNFPV